MTMGNAANMQYMVPSDMTDEDRADFFAWVDSMTPDVAEVARKYPMTTCYRSTEEPADHYVINAYGRRADGKGITVTLVHGSDSRLPGVVPFGMSVEPLVKCDCGKWQGPTAEQAKATNAKMMMRHLKPGAVVQVDPDKCRWGPVFVVVEEVREWGITGYFTTHREGQPGAAFAPIRVEHGNYQTVGRAHWIADAMPSSAFEDGRGDET